LRSAIGNPLLGGADSVRASESLAGNTAMERTRYPNASERIWFRRRLNDHGYVDVIATVCDGIIATFSQPPVRRSGKRPSGGARDEASIMNCFKPSPMERFSPSLAWGNFAANVAKVSSEPSSGRWCC